MQPEKITLNGFIEESKNNYIWGGALTLAWKELSDKIIHGAVVMDT